MYKYTVLFYLSIPGSGGEKMITYIFNNNNIPLYEQLYSFIKKDIENGYFDLNKKLPSRRKFAEHLKVSTSTIDRAYFQLEAEGYIYSKVKKGYFVNFFEKNLHENSENNEKKLFANMKKNEEIKYKYDFKTNSVDIDSFPFSIWAKLMRQVLSENKEEILRDSDPRGIKVLREEISDYLYNFRGIKANPEQIILGSGSEYIYTLLTQIMGRKHKYGIENPGYSKIRKIFQVNGVETLPLTLDEYGICIEEINRSGINIVHATPSHQFPLGMVMPVNRRNTLLNWMNEEAGRYLIEADYDSEFRLSGRPIPALKSLDKTGKVIYVNTFSRSLIPTLRINYILLSEELMDVYWKNYSFYSCSISNIEQLTLAKFMKLGYFERHITRMRKIYKEKRDVFIHTLRQSRLKNKIKIIRQEAGIHLLMEIHNGMSEVELIKSAGRRGVHVYGVSEYYSFSKVNCPEKTLVIGYSGMKKTDILLAVKELEEAWANE